MVAGTARLLVVPTIINVFSLGHSARDLHPGWDTLAEVWVIDLSLSRE